MRAIFLAKQLQQLEDSLRKCRAQIETLYAARKNEAAILDSLPGAGPKLAPRLLVKLAVHSRQLPDFSAMQCISGTSPISYQSGQMNKVYMRRNCDKGFRNALIQLANLSRKSCTWAAVYYDTHKEKGKTHACALRCLANKWVKIIWKMWQSQTLYDPETHSKNQKKHGSWMFALVDTQGVD